MYYKFNFYNIQILKLKHISLNNIKIIIENENIKYN